MRSFPQKLILALAVLVLLGGGIALLLLFPPDGEAVPSPSPSPDGPLLVNEPADALKALTITPAEGVPFTITRAPQGYAILTPTDLFPYETSKLAATAGSAAAQPLSKLISPMPSPDGLSAFGLDPPELVWRLDLTDGTSPEFGLGRPTATRDGYYARRLDRADVFIIPKTDGDNLLRRECDYYDLSFAPTYVEDATVTGFAGEFSHLRWLRPDGSIFEARARSQAELQDGDPLLSSNLLLHPIEAEANDARLAGEVLAKIASIAPGAVVTQDISNLGPYGLDRPVALFASDRRGWSSTLLIGGKDPLSGGRYVMAEGSRAVLLDTAGDYSFLSADPVWLRSPLVWIYSVFDVSRVDITVLGQSHVLELDVTAEETKLSRLDGSGVDEVSARRVFQRVLGISVDGMDAEGTAGDEYARFTIHLRQGGSHTMRLLRLNDRQFFIELDGVNDRFYTGIARVQAVLEGIALTEQGQTVP